MRTRSGLFREGKGHGAKVALTSSAHCFARQHNSSQHALGSVGADTSELQGIRRGDVTLQVTDT